MICSHPNNTGQTAYGKGCRCERCKAAKRAAGLGRPRNWSTACHGCGGERPAGQLRCEPCQRLRVLDNVVNLLELTDSGCWTYIGQRNKGGYGRVRSGRGQVVAHRVTYEHFVGEVPEGLELDHLCRNPSCCNPDHLEAITHSENMKRATYAREAA